MRKIIALLLVLIFLTSLCIIFTEPASSSAKITENSWKSKKSMHEARAYSGVVEVNGKIHVIGGDADAVCGTAVPGTAPSYTAVTINEEYDPSTDTWEIKTPMPTARTLFGTATHQNKIYCIGGEYGTQINNVYSFNVTNVNEVYDPITDTWQTKASIPIAIFGVTANTVNNKIYVIGGASVLGAEGSNVNYVYDPATDSWDSKTPPPNRITSLVSGVIDDKICFIGSSAAGPCIQAYDTQNDSWSTLTASPTMGSGAVGGITSGRYAPKLFYIFVETATYAYDFINDNWTVGIPILTKRLCAGATLVNDMFYVIGGRSGEHGLITIMNPTKTNEVYIPFGYGSLPSVISPENKTYNESSVPLTFTVDELSSWVGYSLDGNDNVTIAGNTTLTGLPNGAHNVTVYAEASDGHVWASETIVFTVTEEPTSFSTLVLAGAFAVTATVVGVSLLYYFRKRNR